MTTVWEPLLASVTKRRSYDARFYKPVFLIAVIDAVTDGAVAVSDIDPQTVIDRFAKYVAPLFQDRAAMGWRPFWHLSNDGAWRFRQDGRLVGPEHFGSERKPNSRIRLLSSIDHVAVPTTLRSAWRDPSARAELRRALLAMLEADDAECQAMASALRGQKPMGSMALKTDGPAPGRHGIGGQGFLASAASRLAVERHAMSLARVHLEGLGWTVEDVSADESYDLLCRRDGGGTLHVEVKGTTGTGDQVQVTRSEVTFANTHEQSMALIVISGVQLVLDEGQPTAVGGTLEMRSPWRPEPERLTPISFMYRLS